MAKLRSDASAQEVFDTVARHLLRQGRRSTRLHKMWGRVQNAYRGDDGLSCAIGCLIPDKRYDGAMEGRDIETLIEWFGESLPGFFGRYTILLGDLQEVHDIRLPLVWKDALVVVAVDHGLSYNAEEYER